MGSKSLNRWKRQKPTPDNDHRHQEQPLIPGLPEHVAELCLTRVHPSLLYSVCRSWRRLINSPLFPPFPSLYTLFFSSSNEEIQLLSFDPISSKWESIPPPVNPLNFLVHHPSFISRNLPVQSISVAGNLVLLAATAPSFIPALSRPLVFSPLSRTWSLGPPMETPRRWCASGASGPAVFVASGIGSNFSSEMEDLPEGMVAGWRGPVAAMDEEVLYAVDESKGVLTRYNQETIIGSDNGERKSERSTPNDRRSRKIVRYLRRWADYSHRCVSGATKILGRRKSPGVGTVGRPRLATADPP
ncbi:Ankyrin repeat family protein [Hibiscus syriacus]|uniref:Ankyrin repeat family protein n=1 Tax=Hibiscus syriacus TaxID=106335 RepID=A0A6A3C005_HIBSY|nr:Ankyrin repeat family protein [Hibiscus syriacus]